MPLPCARKGKHGCRTGGSAPSDGLHAAPGTDLKGARGDGTALRFGRPQMRLDQRRFRIQ